MKPFRESIWLGVCLLVLNTGIAQDKWSLELRPAVNSSAQDIGDAQLKTGFGFEAAIGYRFMPHLGAYAGWGYNTFGSDNSSFAGSNADFDETGYTFGFQFIHPIEGADNFSYLIRAGAIYNHIEVENGDGDIIADSGHGLGWEAGLGIQMELGKNWNLRPQIGYRALSRDLRIGEVVTEVDLNYIAIGVGIAKTF